MPVCFDSPRRGSRRFRFAAHSREHRGREGGELRIAQKQHDFLKLCFADEPSLNRGFVYLPKIGLQQICSRASTRKDGDGTVALHLRESTLTQSMIQFARIGMA